MAKQVRSSTPWRVRISEFLRRARWAADVRTLREFYRPTPGPRTLSVRFAGGRRPFVVRGATLDIHIAECIIRDDSEYRLPVDVQPRVIFDIGANIGSAAVYFAHRHPAARIVCFEPLPENLALLRANVAPLGDRVTVVPKGLGERSGTFTYHYSDDPRNFGGGTFHRTRCDDRSIELPVTTVAEVCRDLGIDRVDAIKIDAEGAEHAILGSIPPELLGQVRVIVGELHGVDDWATLDLLSATHDLEVSKRLGRPCHPFAAVLKHAA